MPKTLGGPCSPKQHMPWLYQGKGGMMFGPLLLLILMHHVLMLLSEETVAVLLL